MKVRRLNPAVNADAANDMPSVVAGYLRPLGMNSCRSTL